LKQKTQRLSLDQKTNRVRELVTDLRSGSLEIAELIMEAHEEDFDGRGFEWTEWAKKEFGFSRRYTFRLSRIAQLLRMASVSGIDLSAACCTNTNKLDILASLNADQLRAFLTLNDISDMDREELRAAVAKFLGKAVDPDDQLDFFQSLKLPPVEKFFEAVVKNVKTLDPDLARAYGCCLVRAAVRERARMTDDDRKVLMSEILELVDTVTGHNVSAIVNQMLHTRNG